MASNGYKSANPDGRDTPTRIEQLHGKEALLQEWELAPVELRVTEKEYIQGLRKRAAQVRNYILHRKDVGSDTIRRDW
jgi:hypothetical protein